VRNRLFVMKFLARALWPLQFRSAKVPRTVASPGAAPPATSPNPTPMCDAPQLQPIPLAAPQAEPRRQHRSVHSRPRLQAARREHPIIARRRSESGNEQRHYSAAPRCVTGRRGARHGAACRARGRACGRCIRRFGCARRRRCWVVQGEWECILGSLWWREGYVRGAGWGGQWS
jgi:hypothetical protein